MAKGHPFLSAFSILSFSEQCFILFSSFILLLAFVVGGLGFEFCVFVAGWRHALWSEWPFIIIIDFEKAFDKVDRNLIWLRLEERGINGNCLEAINNNNNNRGYQGHA